MAKKYVQIKNIYGLLDALDSLDEIKCKDDDGSWFTFYAHDWNLGEFLEFPDCIFIEVEAPIYCEYKNNRGETVIMPKGQMNKKWKGWTKMREGALEELA